MSAKSPQQITDASAIEKMIDEVIAANPKQVEQYRAGKKTMAGFFVGQVMKASKGQANPALLNELVVKSWMAEGGGSVCRPRCIQTEPRQAMELSRRAWRTGYQLPP